MGKGVRPATIRLAAGFFEFLSDRSVAMCAGLVPVLALSIFVVRNRADIAARVAEKLLNSCQIRRRSWRRPSKTGLYGGAESHGLFISVAGSTNDWTDPLLQRNDLKCSKRGIEWLIVPGVLPSRLE